MGTPENIRYDQRGKPLKVENPINQDYESVEFTLANGITNYDLKTGQVTSFVTFPSWMACYIRTDVAISIRINKITNPAISIADYESPFQLKNDIEITNLYITNNSGAQASIKILAFNRAYGHT